MKIAFDHTAFSIQDYGGITRYFVNLNHHLSLLNVKTNICTYFSKNEYLDEINHGALRFSFGNRKRYNYLINEVISLVDPRLLDADIIHTTYYGFLPKHLNKTKVVTVFDMIHEKFSENFHHNDRVAKLKASAIKSSDHIVCISQSTKSDLLYYFPQIESDKVSVVHLASFNSKPLQRSNLPKKNFILYVGERRGYKNFSCLVNAYANSENLKKDFVIVCFGGGAFSNEEITLFRKLELSQKISHKSGSNDVLANLYTCASCLVHTSNYEGFGLPLLEALSYCCPVIASKNSSVPEVLKDAGIYFRPDDINDLSKKLNQYLYASSYEQTKIIEKGIEVNKQFSWKKTANQTLEIYKGLLKNEK